jgi:chaperone required for assembly of F1-ATPase
MNEPNWNESVRQAQKNMRAPVVKRFYKVAEVAPHEGGFAVTLDGRVARTPAKAKLVAPTETLARALAAEWEAQREILEPHAMPLTRLANSALDGVAEAVAETVAAVAAYAGSDLVCFRADETPALAERQAAAFDPVLDFAERRLGARFLLAGGIMPVSQPAAALDAVRAAVEAHENPFALTALADLTSLSGSVLIALSRMANWRRRKPGPPRMSMRNSRSNAGAATPRRRRGAISGARISPPPPSSCGP